MNEVNQGNRYWREIRSGRVYELIYMPVYDQTDEDPVPLVERPSKAVYKDIVNNVVYVRNWKEFETKYERLH